MASTGGGLNTEALEVPIGTIIAFMGNTPPENYLACDGNIYRIADYKPVANFINLQFGSFNYFGGDGVDTFAVPDLRGEFLRGTGTNSHPDSGNGASVGVHQNSTQIPYVQNYQDNLIGFDVGPVRWNTGTYSDKDIIGASNTRRFINLNISKSALSYRMSTVRPTNTSVLYCIKYKNS